MAKDGKLVLTLLGPDGASLQGKVDVFLEHQVLSDRRALRGVDASEKIVITDLHRIPQGLYLVRATTADNRTASLFVNIKPSGDTKIELTLGSLRPPGGGDDPVVEKERLEFKSLLAENPNFFGNVTDKALAQAFAPVVSISGNTSYEQLHCVGLYPEDDLLEAVLEIKRAVGYQGSLCQEGSKEYVAFYIDWGSGFVGTGAPAQVNVHNLAFVNGGHVFYAVRKPFLPQLLERCTQPQVVRVRAILSWEAIPTGPGYVPVWGNVVDVWVQIRPKKKPVLVVPGFVDVAPFQILDPPPVLEAALPFVPIPPEKYFLHGSKEEIKALLDHSLAAEDQIRRKGTVETKRLDLKTLLEKNPNHFGGISEADKPDEILAAVAKLPAKTAGYLAQFGPDVLKPVEVFLQSTKYEQLRCVGLYPEDDLLEAVIEVKLPNGFSGDLCSLGSKEYVAFYIDWGGGYQHVATSAVAVYDIPEAADRSLHYAVRAPISDPRLKACTIENVVKVKAILSWNVDPTPFGHTYTPTWGNVLVRNVQIRPENGVSAHCDLEIVNEVHTDDIAQVGVSEGLAIKIDGGGLSVPGTYDRPFGGVIACWGNVNVSGAPFYRFRFKEDVASATWQPVLDKRRARGFLGITLFREPDAEGWFSVSEYQADVASYSLTALVHWNSDGKNGKYRLRLEMGDAAKNPLPQVCEVAIVLDNVWPELLDFSGTPTPLPAKGVVVKDGAGDYKKCGTFFGPEPIRVFGNFRDDYFLAYSLIVFGGNIDVSGLSIGSARYDSFGTGIPVGNEGVFGAVSGAAGLGRELVTPPLNLCTVHQSPGAVRCAYGIQLDVSDRSIVGHLGGYEFDTSHHGVSAFVTFDWDPEGC